MANDTFAEIASKVLLRSPTTPQTLARDWVQSAFREIADRRRWSWLLKRGELTTVDQYAVGTATVLAGTQTVTLNAPGVVSANFVGRQFRVGVPLPIVTITSVNVVTNTMGIDQIWWPRDQTAQPYAIYQAYVALPTDFHAFVSVIDPAFAQPVPFGASVAYIDSVDPQRAAAGSPPRFLAYFDYFNGFPRYELWPHQRTAQVFPMVYESRPVDPYDTGASVPALMPSDVILERAMMYCAAWPGAGPNNPNMYFSKQLLAFHQAEFEKRLTFIEKQDNEHMQQNIWYQSEQIRRTALISGSWMQQHDLSGY